MSGRRGRRVRGAWTEADIARLRKMSDVGCTIDRMAIALGRSENAVELKHREIVGDHKVWRGARLDARTEAAFAAALGGQRYVDHPRARPWTPGPSLMIARASLAGLAR